MDDRGCANRYDAMAEHLGAVVGWLVKRRGAPIDAAEDAVQEAILQLVETADRFWPDNVGGWLRRTAERRLIDANRRRRFMVMEDDEDAFPTPAPDLDSILAVRAALSDLEPEARRVVVLRLAGYSWSQVAHRSGATEEGARKRFVRAIAILATRLDSD